MFSLYHIRQRAHYLHYWHHIPVRIKHLKHCAFQRDWLEIVYQSRSCQEPRMTFIVLYSSKMNSKSCVRTEGLYSPTDSACCMSSNVYKVVWDVINDALKWCWVGWENICCKGKGARIVRIKCWLKVSTASLFFIVVVDRERSMGGSGLGSLRRAKVVKFGMIPDWRRVTCWSRLKCSSGVLIAKMISFNSNIRGRSFRALSLDLQSIEKLFKTKLFFVLSDIIFDQLRCPDLWTVVEHRAHSFLLLHWVEFCDRLLGHW